MIYLSYFKLILISLVLWKLSLIHGKLNGQHVVMQNILERLQREKSYSSVLLMQSKNFECFQENIFEVSEVPIINMDAQRSYYLKSQFNSKMLALVCLQYAENLKALDALAYNLENMRDNRVLILLKENYGNVKRSSVRTLFKTCRDLNLIFVNLFFMDFYESQFYLSYKRYPHLEIENHSLLLEDQCLFPNELSNFQGKQLKVGASMKITKTHFSYKTTSKAGGILGLFMESYAKAFNVSIFYEKAISSFVFMDNQEKYSLTIALGVFDPFKDSIENCLLLRIGWLVVLLPMDKPMKKDKFLISLFCQTIKIYGLIILITISAIIAILEKRRMSDIMKMEGFRGILGFSFIMRRRPGFLLGLLYMLIILQGFFNSTIYPANLGTVFTLMPKEKPVHTFDELLERGYPKILKGQSEENLTLNLLNDEKYAPLYVYTNHSGDFFYDEVLPNPNYAYDYLSDYWPLHDYVQKKYKIKLFRLENKLIYPLPSPIILGFIFPPNTPFLKSIKRSYARAVEGGLQNGWILHNRSVSIPKTDTEAHPLTVDDYGKLFVVYLFMLTMAFFVFLIEICYFYVIETKCN